jgi:hypothetical protein
MPENRIPSRLVSKLTEPLFDRRQFTGAELARYVGAKPITFWSWFTRRGVPVSVARQTAERMVEWSATLLVIAASLMTLARAAEQGTLPSEGEGQEETGG